MLRPFHIVLFGFLLWSAPELRAVEEEADPVPAADGAEAPTGKIDGRTPAERAKALLEYCTTQEPSAPLVPKQAIAAYASRMILDRNGDEALARFSAMASATLTTTKQRLAKNPEDGHAFDPFDKQALVHGWLVCRGTREFPAATVASIRDYVALWHHRVWKGYGALNYRLMNDGAGFLAAEQWPDLVDADGLKAAEIQAATKGRLLGYFADTVRRNFHEFGSPTYGGVDFSAMKMIADFAQDAQVRQAATLTLDWMLLNVACAWNQGYHVTPAGRAKYFGTTNTGPDDMDAAAGIGWIWYGGHRPVRPSTQIHSFWFACPAGTYQPPALFAAIAQDRAAPVLHQGSVILGATDLRYQIYHTPSHSLASAWEFVGGPTDGHYKESRRQMLKWISDKPQSTFAPMQENPRRPYRLEEKVANAFGYGENPFAQSLQFQGTLVGITDVPENYPYYKLYAPFSTTGSIHQRLERDGWICCHTGGMLFAFRTLMPGAWGKHRDKERSDVWTSDARRNGWILETSPLAPFAGGGEAAELTRFAEALTTKTRIDRTGLTAAKPRFAYTTLDGHVLDLTYRAHKEPYAAQHQVDGKPVRYREFPLLGNPWVQQDVNGTLLKIHHGDQELTYDFAAWTCAGR